MTLSQPLVSIVTPVYNEEKYLPECIESILAQTYQNWECTIIDNCSTDASVEIARRYAARDRRIRIHQNQQFLPVIANHNEALRQISHASKYCKMVLGDDWIFPECLERMVAVAEHRPSVGIVGAYALEGERVVLTGLPYSTTVVAGRDACRSHLLERQHVFGTPTSVLYRADLVRARNLFFNEKNIHADTEVCFALLESNDFGFVHQVLTFTRVRPGSLQTRSLAMETDRAANLLLLVSYGKTYLTQNELRDQLAEHVSAYYQFLGKSLLLGRNKEFWAFHRQRLSEAGVSFSKTRVALGVLAAMARPVSTLKNPVARLLRLRPRSLPAA
jgi:glycosyltransferase involved in cell wall biosynthesis